MADLLVAVGGREYRLACRDGEEDALKAAARLLDGRARELQEALGAVTEPRLLLMAGLMIAGEALEGGRAAPVDPPSPAPPASTTLEAPFETMVMRLEALASRLEAIARSARGLEEPPAAA